MNRIINFVLRTMLREEVTEEGEASGGLVAGLDAFINENEGVTATEKGTQVAVPTEPVTIEPTILDNGTPPAKAPVVETPAVETPAAEFESGLPTIGEEVVEPVKPVETPAFNEETFDAETAAIVAQIEKSGHPGDVYRDLRGKLKEFEKSETTSPQLQTRLTELETQNMELQAQADRVKAMEEKVTSVTSRNAELLLEEDPDYAAKVAAPYDDITKTVGALAQAKGVAKAEIWAAINEKDAVTRLEKLEELEGKLGARHTLMVQTMSDDIRKIAVIDQDMRSRAEEIVSKAKEGDQEASAIQIEQRDAAVRSATVSSFREYGEKIPGYTDTGGRLTDKGRVAQARGSNVNADKLGSGDIGYMVFATQALPQALEAIDALQTENRDLRVAAGTAADGIVSGSPVKKEAPDEHVDPATNEPRTFMDGFNNQTFVGDHLLSCVDATGQSC